MQHILTASDGGQLGFSEQGCTVTSWHASGAQRLWLSPLAAFGPQDAVRGGIPVIFPQFSDRGPYARHGVARNRPWIVEPVPGAACFKAGLQSNEQTRADWPFDFDLRLRVEADQTQLMVTVEVTNTDTRPWQFSFALHTYLAVHNNNAQISGLEGCRGEDNAAAGAPFEVPASPLVALEQRDWAIRDVPGTVRLEQPGQPGLALEQTGFRDCVVWHPGDAAVSDIPSAELQRFCCIESALLEPATLEPGARWRAQAAWRVQ